MLICELTFWSEKFMRLISGSVGLPMYAEPSMVNLNPETTAASDSGPPAIAHNLLTGTFLFFSHFRFLSGK